MNIWVKSVAATFALTVAGPALADAPDVFDKCGQPFNFDAYARSCANTSAFGVAGGGQFSVNSAGIGNGFVDLPNTYAQNNGAVSTASSKSGWANTAMATSNTGTASTASSDVTDGTVHGFVSNPNSFYRNGFTVARISDIVTFNNTSGAAIVFNVGYAFDGTFTAGQNGFDNFTEANIFLALRSPGRTVKFAASGRDLSGYAHSYANAVTGSVTPEYYDMVMQDGTFIGSYTSGLAQGTFNTALLIPVGLSDLGFAFTLTLDCRANASTCDFGHTGTFAFGALPTGLSYTSQSGVLFSGLGGPGGVPEPASWALMLAGFGLVGAAMRRRAKLTVTYA